MKHPPYHPHPLIPLFLLLIGCARPPLPPTDPSGRKKVERKIFAIKNVNVLPMTLGGRALANATVVITGERISSVNGLVPNGAEIIDGTGRWLIPGLIDMHVHVPTDMNFNPPSPTRAATVFFDTQDVMTPYVANGVTTIFDLNSKAEHFGQRNEIARGDAVGPRMALAALINGGEGSGRLAHTPADGRQTVRIAREEGYGFIKVYSQLDIETYLAIVDEAGKQGMKVVGHIPNAFRGAPGGAFVPNFGMVAHAEEFAKLTENFSDRDAARFARIARENGTWLTPALAAMVSIARQARSLDAVRNMESLQYVHPLLQSKWLTSNNYNTNANSGLIARFDKIVAFNSRLVKAFKAAGVPLVAGTDTGVSGVVAGFSLHDEIELLVEAGLTPEESLASATRLPAVWLGIDGDIGTVEAGKYADLVLLDADPLLDVRNARRIAGVFVNGRWLAKPDLDAMLADLSRRNSDARDRYDWKKRKEY